MNEFKSPSAVENNKGEKDHGGNKFFNIHSLFCTYEKKMLKKRYSLLQRHKWTLFRQVFVGLSSRQNTISKTAPLCFITAVMCMNTLVMYGVDGWCNKWTTKENPPANSLTFLEQLYFSQLAQTNQVYTCWVHGYSALPWKLYTFFKKYIDGSCFLSNQIYFLCQTAFYCLILHEIITFNI